MPSNVRPLRSVGALDVRPVTTPVPWGTPANPANVPMPRGDEEWGRASRPCSDDDAVRVQAAVARYGEPLTDMFGAGFTSGAALSDYSAWMALGIVDLHGQLLDAIEAADKERVLNVAGAHYRARPVRRCAECDQDTPHSQVYDDTWQCLVCGDRGQS